MHLANNTMKLAASAKSPQMDEFKVTLAHYLQHINNAATAVEIYKEVIDNSGKVQCVTTNSWVNNPGKLGYGVEPSSVSIVTAMSGWWAHQL